MESVPALQNDSAPFAGPYRRPNPAKVSRIVMDFVRDKADGPFRVNTHRRQILTQNGQTVSGVLNIYNFGDKPFTGTVRGVLPERWSGPDGFAVEVPPMGRVKKAVSFTSPTGSFTGAHRVGFETDGGASVAYATFERAPELDAEKVCDLTDAVVTEVAQNRMALKDGVLTYEFSGQPLCAFLTADVPASAGRADGLLFTLRRMKAADGQPETSFAYIDVVAIDKSGRESWLQPNIFPLFLDGVEEECHCIRFDRLSPKIAPEDVAKVQIRFNTFGGCKGRTQLRDFSLWRSRSLVSSFRAARSWTRTGPAN